MNEQKPILQEIEVRYDISCASEKEAVKEFFRFIGCLVYERLVSSEQGLEDALNDPMDQSTQIFLRSKKHKQTDLKLLQSQEAEKRQGSLICVFCDEKKTQPEIWPELEPRITGTKQSSDYAKTLVGAIIDAVWSEEPGQKEAVQQVHNIYSEQSLLVYLQCKRSFRILRMNEILEMDNSIDAVPDEPFVWNMLRAFQQTMQQLSPQKNKSVYSFYAYVNAARKIREVAQQLPQGAIVEDVVSAGSLLKELNKMEDLFPSYAGRYFLAAFICLTNDELKLQANRYYLRALESADPELAEKFFANGLGVEMDLGRKSYFVAFIFYQIGLYYEKVLKNLNAAIIYYTCAVRCNENCYQALFKQACAAAKRNRFREATEMFDEILILLSKGLELEEPQNWKYISAKEWQYLYKVNIWRAKIEWQCRGKTYTWQYLQGADLAVKAYRENGCLIELLEPDSLIYRDLIAYHVKSAPVQKLEKLLEIWKEISRMYEP